MRTHTKSLVFPDFLLFFMRGGDSELLNYLVITLNLNCVQIVFTFFNISKICAMVFSVGKE